jgi:hypothetical protein
MYNLLIINHKNHDKGIYPLAKQGRIQYGKGINPLVGQRTTTPAPPKEGNWRGISTRGLVIERSRNINPLPKKRNIFTNIK